MTNLETKIAILADFYLYYAQEEEYADWAEAHDLGLPLSILVEQKYATATPAGVEWIISDYNDLCEELGIDKHGDYTTIEQMLELSDEQG